MDSPEKAIDPILAQVSETSLRLMAGEVPRSTMREVKKLAQGQANYPWREVVERVLDDPVDPDRLLQQGLQAQRDWVCRGGRETPKPGLRRRGKVLAAGFLARLLFFLAYTVVLVILLVLMKHVWPAVDIYSLLDWLREQFPQVFSPP